MNIWGYLTCIVTIACSIQFSLTAPHPGFLSALFGSRGKGGGSKTSCNARRDPGPCRAAIESYYWDKDTKDCDTFLFGGNTCSNDRSYDCCGGNQNRFSTYSECIQKCKPKQAFDKKRVDEMYKHEKPGYKYKLL